MATKKQIHLDTVTAVTTVCAENAVKQKVQDAIIAILDTNLAPKSGGAQIDVESVVTRDSEGNVSEMVCAVSGVSLPANLDFFYEDKHGKGFAETGLRRLSRQAEGIRKVHAKTVGASEKAIMNDVMEAVLSPEDGKAKLEALKATKPDYSSVTAELPTEDSAE